jgi:hypothetical protein
MSNPNKTDPGLIRRRMEAAGASAKEIHDYLLQKARTWGEVTCSGGSQFRLDKGYAKQCTDMAALVKADARQAGAARQDE